MRESVRTSAHNAYSSGGPSGCGPRRRPDSTAISVARPESWRFASSRQAGILKRVGQIQGKRLRQLLNRLFKRPEEVIQRFAGNPNCPAAIAVNCGSNPACRSHRKRVACSANRKTWPSLHLRRPVRCGIAHADINIRSAADKSVGKSRRQFPAAKQLHRQLDVVEAQCMPFHFAQITVGTGAR